jgi:uncharacterized protein (TIGR00255 family)
MTGFARTDGGRGTDTWHWEIRSVNGRSLEVRLRVPPGLEDIESRIRETCAKRLGRGNCNVTLTWERASSGTSIRLNEAALADVARAMEAAQRLLKTAPPALDGILAIRGVLETVEANETEEEAATRSALMLADLDKAIDGLVAARQREGERLTMVLSQQIEETARLAALLEAAPQRRPEHVMARLEEAIARLRQTSSDLDADRLHQEAMLIATRIDIAEEIARLKSHIEEARALLGSQEPVGRRLDFLAQEFNREANTICSKANDAALTRIGLDLKAVIDQLREQVQNIE